MGGGKKRGVGNLTNDTLPENGFWTPPRTVRFPPLSGVSALFFLYKNPRQSRPKALLEGSKIFGRARSLVRFPPPYVLHPPPYHGPIYGGWGSSELFSAQRLRMMQRALWLLFGWPILERRKKQPKEEVFSYQGSTRKAEMLANVSISSEG